MTTTPAQAKYELTDNVKTVADRTLHQIRALRDIPRHAVTTGDLGGWIETEKNLAHDGDAWVSGGARVSGGAQVYGGAWVSGGARVSGCARVSGDAQVYGGARVSGDAWVYGDAQVTRAQHVLTIGPVGSEDQTFTVYRTEDGGHQCIVGCWGPGTLTELATEVERRKREYWRGRGDAEIGRWEAQYRGAITLGEVMAESWAADHAAKAGA